MSTVSNGTSKLFVANSFPVCFVNYVILGGGGGCFANPPRPQKEVVQHADLGSKCAFVHFVTGPVSVIDARLKCYLTNNRKTSLNRNNETIKSANIVVLQNSTE